MNSETDWTCIVNDDIHYERCWDDQFRKLVEKKPEFDIFLLCHPYNWSGFAVNRRFVAQYPFRLEFPEGYYEDDDIYLRVAYRNHRKNKNEVYTKDIYCLPYNESRKGAPRRLFKHVPIHSKQESEFHNRWDDQANLKVFLKYWAMTNPSVRGAIQSKNEQDWWKPTEETKRFGK